MNSESNSFLLIIFFNICYRLRLTCSGMFCRSWSSVRGHWRWDLILVLFKSIIFFYFFIFIGAAIAASPALVGCNSAFGICEAACVAALVAPTPWTSLRQILFQKTFEYSVLSVNKFDLWTIKMLECHFQQYSSVTLCMEIFQLFVNYWTSNN